MWRFLAVSLLILPGAVSAGPVQLLRATRSNSLQLIGQQTQSHEVEVNDFSAFSDRASFFANGPPPFHTRTEGDVYQSSSFSGDSIRVVLEAGAGHEWGTAFTAKATAKFRATFKVDPHCDYVLTARATVVTRAGALIVPFHSALLALEPVSADSFRCRDSVVPPTLHCEDFREYRFSGTLVRGFEFVLRGEVYAETPRFAAENESFSAGATLTMTLHVCEPFVAVQPTTWSQMKLVYH